MGFIRKDNNGNGGEGGSITIVNNLNSSSTTSALSANQGKILNEKIEAINVNEPIDINRLSFAIVSKNLFDKTKVSSNKGLNYGNWIESDKNDYYLSDYIMIEADTSYTLRYGYCYAFYDSNKTLIGGGYGEGSTAYTFTTPTNAKYIRFDLYYTLLNLQQLELGDSYTSYEDYYCYIPNDCIESIDIPNNSISIEKVDFIECSKNLYNKNKSSEQGSYVAYNTGIITSNQYTTSLSYSEYIKIKPNTNYTISGGKIHSWCFFDKNKNYISGAYEVTTSKTIVTPSNVEYMILNTYYEYNDLLQLEEGSEATSYESYYIRLVGSEKTINDNKVKLTLPDKFELVVGDTFELFYKGFILAKNPYNYNLNIECAKGNAYSKRYIYTPTSSDVGSYTMTISLKDDNDNILDSKQVILNVNNIPSNPSSMKNILCIGDSLTSNGFYVNELYRRLTASDGVPMGYGLTNVSCVGTVTNGTVNYEGYGGWTWNSYNTDERNQNAYSWIIVSSGMKTSADQHAIYKDSNNVEWIIETIDIDNNKLKIKKSKSSSNTLPTSGTLTWVSGGSDTSNIVYTFDKLEGGNPFWFNDKVDFNQYCTNLGINTIDYIYALLGWNCTYLTDTELKTQIITFINNVQSDLPNCKITLLGLQVPSEDGLGHNYGCSWNYMDKFRKIMEINNIYKEIASEFENVDYIDIASQFDTEHNIITSTRTVNTRSEIQETYGINGVHPSTSGYLQIADAILRNLINKL